MASKKATIKLDVNFDIPFFAFGISSSEKILAVSIEFNKLLELNLSLSKSIEIKRINNIVFNVFSFYNHDNDVNYFLIANKSKDGCLFDIYKNIDYLFIVSSNEQKTINTNEMLKKIKSKIFLLVTELKISTKKEKKIINDLLYQLLTK